MMAVPVGTGNRHCWLISYKTAAVPHLVRIERVWRDLRSAPVYCRTVSGRGVLVAAVSSPN